MEVCNEKQLEGYFKFTFSTKDLPSGSSNVIIKADDKKQVEKLIIER